MTEAAHAIARKFVDCVRAGELPEDMLTDDMTGWITTGGTMSSGTPYLMVESSPAACQADDGFYFKQPVIISYQMVLSFRNISNQLNLVADPVITLWNPLDVPVVVPTSSFLTVKYWQIPYDLMISKNGGPFQSFPLAATLSGASTTVDGDSNFLSIEMGATQSLVFKPGFSTFAISGVPLPSPIPQCNFFNGVRLAKRNAEAQAL